MVRPPYRLYSFFAQYNTHDKPCQQKAGLDHRIGHARVFFPDRQELAIAQTACRSSKNTLARPPRRRKLAETMIKARKPYFLLVIPALALPFLNRLQR
jgi:hypothetical protein